MISAVVNPARKMIGKTQTACCWTSVATECSDRAIVQVKHSIAIGEMQMPLINVKVIEGVFSPAQKQEVVRKLTDAMVSIEGENMRPVTWCIVEEVKSGD
jgi:4-oxalocrotonate tautomerase